MLKAGSKHRELPIVVSPKGTFYTPTTPEGYGEAEAMSACLSGDRSCTLQHVWIGSETFFRGSRWMVGTEALQFGRFPKEWKILEGRPFQVPETVTPEFAKELTSEEEAR